MKYRNILLIIIIIFTTLPLVSQNYVGSENSLSMFTGQGFTINDNKLYFQGINFGVASIDLSTYNLRGILPDTDESTFVSFDYEAQGNKIYNRSMHVFDDSTFELIDTLPYEEVKYIDVTEDEILTITQDDDLQIIDKSDYLVADTLKIKELNEGEFYKLDKGYLVLRDNFNTFTFYKGKEKVSRFSIDRSPQYLHFSNDYIVFEYNLDYEVYDIYGIKLYETGYNSLSNIYIDKNADFVYLNSGNGTELIKGNLITGAKEVKKIGVLNPSDSWYYDFVGIYDNRYIVYDRGSNFIYSYSKDFSDVENITKFNGPLRKFKKIDHYLYEYAVVNSGMYNTITLLDEHTAKIKKVSYENQADPIYHPIHPFEIRGDNLYLPINRNGLFQILDYNINTDEYNFFGDFGSRVTSIYADEEANELYVGEYEVFRSSFDMTDNSFIQEYSYGNASYLDITKVNGNVSAITEFWQGINFIDFETNEIYASTEGSNNWRFGTQFGYSSNKEKFICPLGNIIVVHDLKENKEIARYDLGIESKITSLALTNDADFIVIGTENDGVYEYTPATDKLVRSKQNRLIPTNNYEGGITYSQVNDIVISENKNKYHFIVRDLVFATADYEVVKTSIEDNSEIRTITFENGILNLENYLGSEVISISNISGQEVTYSQVEHRKYKINNKDKLLFLKLRNGTEIMTFKLIAD